MDEKTNQLLRDIYQNIEEMGSLKDPFKDVFLKKLIGGSIITDVAKITSKGAIEFYAGGGIETHDEKMEVNLLNFKNRGFIECDKNEYDSVVKRAVREINALV